MTNRANERTNGRLGAALALAFGLALGACGEKKVEAPAPAPPPPPPPPRQVTASELTMDPRVQFPETTLPTDRELAQAVAGLASAIVKGDADALHAMLDEAASGVLRSLQDSGEWKTSTKDIEAVRVVALESGEGGAAKVGLGVQSAKGAYLLAWAGQESNGSWVFTGLPIESRSATRVADLDGVALSERPIPQPLAEGPKGTSRDPRAIEAEKRRDRGSPNRSGSPRPSDRPGPPLLPGGG